MSFQPMLAHHFYDSSLDAKYHETGKIPKGGFIFNGTSGTQTHNNKWIFESTPTLYAVNPAKWFISVKLDGVRGTWIGSKGAIISRGNNVFHAPSWFIEKFPKNHNLDGELWIPGETFATVAGIVKRKIPIDKDWKRIKFCIFDMPDPDLVKRKVGFQTRIPLYDKVIGHINVSHLIMIKQFQVENMKEAYDFYKSRIIEGHEGCVLRGPNSAYVYKRSHEMLKWKPILTMEAKIIGFNHGTGVLANHLGTFKVQLVTDPKIIFNLSGKMNHDFRSKFIFKNGKLIHQPKLPSDIVTFEYMTLSDAGVPRQPVFIGFREVD